MVADGALDKEMFTAYAERILVPALRKGDIDILDNLPAHELPEAHEAVEATLILLPPCCADFIPIEEAFVKLKAILPKAS